MPPTSRGTNQAPRVHPKATNLVRVSDAHLISDHHEPFGYARLIAVSLRGHVIVVAGGAGVAGECVVAALLARGATVAVPSRSGPRLERLRAVHDCPDLHTYLGAMDSADGAADVCARIVADLGQIHGVVASLGGWWAGHALVDLPEATWRELLDVNLTSHFLAARAFLPALVNHRSPAARGAIESGAIAPRRRGVYLTLNGIAADKAVANSGPISATGAAQRMMLRVLAEELLAEDVFAQDMGAGHVRLHEVTVRTPIITRHWDGSPIQPGWLDGHVVGAYVADVLDPDFPHPDRMLLGIPDPWPPAS